RMIEQRAVAVAHLANPPAAMAMTLEEEYVVVIEVWSDSATRCGVADHHVVDTPAGQEAEVLKQFGHFRHELVDRLYQEGPVAFGELAETVFGKRSAAQLPGLRAMLDDQA